MHSLYQPTTTQGQLVWKKDIPETIRTNKNILPLDGLDITQPDNFTLLFESLKMMAVILSLRVFHPYKML